MLCAVARGATSAGLTPEQTLTAALTVGGLILVAFSMAFNLAAPAEGGRHPFFANGWFGWAVAIAITCAAASAGAAWWDLYHSPWPHGLNAWVKAGGIAVGIAVQPIFAFVINSQARKL
jgi:hypothetical protein